MRREVRDAAQQRDHERGAHGPRTGPTEGRRRTTAPECGDTEGRYGEGHAPRRSRERARQQDGGRRRERDLERDFVDVGRRAVSHHVGRGGRGERPHGQVHHGPGPEARQRPQGRGRAQGQDVELALIIGQVVPRYGGADVEQPGDAPPRQPGNGGRAHDSCNHIQGDEVGQASGGRGLSRQPMVSPQIRQVESRDLRERDREDGRRPRRRHPPDTP